MGNYKCRFCKNSETFMIIRGEDNFFFRCTNCHNEFGYAKTSYHKSLEYRYNCRLRIGNFWNFVFTREIMPEIRLFNPLKIKRFVTEMKDVSFDTACKHTNVSYLDFILNERESRFDLDMLVYDLSGGLDGKR